MKLISAKFEARTTKTTKLKPNPGSEAALKLGCKCSVLDNAHGKGTPLGFWVTYSCPIHGEGIMS